MKIFNLKIINYQLKSNRGFTLIETLVAISILMIAVASPLTITQKGLASAIYAKDQIIASYLAQDAIEYLKNASDRNVAEGNNWLRGGKDIKNPCAGKCSVDTNNDVIKDCGGLCLPLKYDSVSGIYNHTATDQSQFTRSITVNEKVSGIEALVTVNISWADKNTQRSLDFYTRIYNWR